MELLHSPRENAIVNLVGLPFADRAVFVTELLPELIKLRAKSARPHWIILDEATISSRARTNKRRWNCRSK